MGPWRPFETRRLFLGQVLRLRRAGGPEEAKNGLLLCVARRRMSQEYPCDLGIPVYSRTRVRGYCPCWLLRSPLALRCLPALVGLAGL